MRHQARRTSLRAPRFIPLMVLAFAAAPRASAQDAGAADPRLIRQELTAVNAAWSAVRLACDSARAASLLEPDFYVALRDRRATRDEFIRAVSTCSPASVLTRFDNPILTIIKGEGTGEWVALVLEKLEYVRTAPDGTKTRTYHLWITRDGYRRTGPATWRIMYSQEVMHESWVDGNKPPFPDWDRTGMP